MQFDDEFFASIGLDEASDEKKQALAEQLAELIQNRIALRLGESLSDEQADHFAELIDQDKEELAFDYLEEVFPEYPQVLQEEIDRARGELVADMQSAVSQLNDDEQGSDSEPQDNPHDHDNHQDHHHHTQH
jgi:hypothetical protein